VRTTGLFTSEHSHVNRLLYRHHGYRQTRTSQTGACLLVHLAQGWPRRLRPPGLPNAVSSVVWLTQPFSDG